MKPGTTITSKSVACAGPAMSARNANASAAVRAMPGTLGALARGEPALAAAVALALGLALVLFGPPPGDLPAHLYRTELVRERRLRLGHVLVCGPLPTPHLQPPLLLPGRAGRERRLGARLRRRRGGALRVARGARVGRRGALAGPRLRRGRLRPALHRDVSVRGRSGRRPGRAEGAPARAAVDCGRARRAHARASRRWRFSSFASPCVAAFLARRRTGRSGGGGRGRRAARAGAVPGRTAAPLPRGGRVPVFRLGGAGRRHRRLRLVHRTRPAEPNAGASLLRSSRSGRSPQSSRSWSRRRSART